MSINTAKEKYDELIQRKSKIIDITARDKLETTAQAWIQTILDGKR